MSFDGDTVPADGMFPNTSGVTLDSNGNLYGTTVYGGSFGDGIVYEYSSAGKLSTLVTFSGPNGWNPEGNLTFDSKGNLYGVTNQGGTSGYGTVYMLTPNPGGGSCGGIRFVSDSEPRNGAGWQWHVSGHGDFDAAAPSGGTLVGLSSDSSFALTTPT